MPPRERRAGGGLGRRLLRGRGRPRAEGEVSTPERQALRALDGFNDTDQTRKVAGLTRSLGDPQVSVVPLGARGDGNVRVTVAWELAWYQWEVKVTDEGLAVRELASGDEIEQLAEVDRAWNARADDAGLLRYGVAG